MAMDVALSSFAALAVTVVILLATRARGLLTHVLTEAMLVAAIGGLLLYQGGSPLPNAGNTPPGLNGVWLRAVAIIWWLIGARLVVNIMAALRANSAGSRQARLFSDLSAGIIYITCALIILNSVLGLNIIGLLATSGVIAIVLGLALQNTLADVFSGIAVGVEQPFHVGDRVSLGDHVEGTVVQMNWRSVRIQTDGDDTATMPNSLVAKGQIINYSVPTRRRAATIEIAAPTEIPAGKVFELMRQAAMLCPALLTDPAPSFTILHSGRQNSLYATNFHVADSPAATDAKSMLLRQTRRMFRHAGIGRACPISPAELLRAIIVFEALSQDEVAEMAANLVISVVEPGEIVFEQGAVAESFYVIEAGILEISRTVAGLLPQTLGRIGPGEYIGEIGLMTGLPRAFTMRAVTHARIAEVPSACLKTLLGSHAALNTAMEQSVRRGLALLDRDDAARIVEPAAPDSELFLRIKAFFGLGDGAHPAINHVKGD